MIQVDVTVIGGGIVGCAAAAAAARRHPGVVLLEKESRLATGVTARNSEVAHGGMYYPTDTLKARCCVEGRRLLKSFCADSGVDYRECGKLIVAVDDAGLPRLEELRDRGLANGVEGLRLIDGEELKRLEPEVAAVAALHSPATAIVDAEGAARAYARLAAERGAQVLTGARVVGLRRTGTLWQVAVERAGGESWIHRSRHVVVAAGLHADETAALAGIDPDEAGLRQHWIKGNYFAVAAAHAGRISRLVYPLPPAGKDTLGVHVCLDRAGQLRLGPDFEPGPRVEDYGVDPERGEAFFAGASRFLPFLDRQDLTPAMAGLRPKLTADGEFRDFVVRGGEGPFEGLVALAGIDSPGLTSAPALARRVAALLAD